MPVQPVVTTNASTAAQAVDNSVEAAEVSSGVTPDQGVDGPSPLAGTGQVGDSFFGADGNITKQGPATAQANVPWDPSQNRTGNSAIDNTLNAFGQANASNPKVAKALEQAADDIKADPGKFLNPDGSVNESALKDEMTKCFASVGPITLPPPGSDGETNNNSEVTSQSTGPTPGEVTTVTGSRTYPNLGSMGQEDIMAICFIVMMEATKSAQEDLKAIMDGVKDINKQKDGWRSLQEKINKGCAALAGQNAGDAPNFGNLNNALGVVPGTGTGMGDNVGDVGDKPCPDGSGFYGWDYSGSSQYYSFNTPGENGTVVEPGLVIQGAPPKVQDWLDAKDTIKNKLDSLSEMGETESLRLQMAMDRVSKFMQTLSNIEKKMSDTDSAITQNQK